MKFEGARHSFHSVSYGIRSLRYSEGTTVTSVSLKYLSHLHLDGGHILEFIEKDMLPRSTISMLQEPIIVQCLQSQATISQAFPPPSPHLPCRHLPPHSATVIGLYNDSRGHSISVP